MDRAQPKELHRLGVILLVALLSCSSAPHPDPLACPDLPAPDLDLASDAAPDPAACFAVPEVRKYLDEWRVALLESWQPPEVRGKRRAFGVVLSMDAEGRVARYCVRPGGTHRLRRSVIEALDEFAPPAEPPQAIAACLAHKRISADFKTGMRP